MTTPDQPEAVDLAESLRRLAYGAVSAAPVESLEFVSERKTVAAEVVEAFLPEVNAAYKRGVAEGLRRATTAVRAQAGLPDLVHFNRPSDFRKGVLTCLAALESLAGPTAEGAPDA